jgi:GDSL-like Lipase/Acylhydrolase
MIKNIKWLLLVSLTFVACSEDDEVIVYNSSDGLPLTAGTADFSKYVALGDSFAAGYSDNALFIEGQKGAYPNILAQQFALVGGGEFTTPFMNDNIGGLLLSGNFVAGPRLYFNGVAPVPVSGTPSTEITNHLSGFFNNMGVPGAKSFHLLAPGYGNAAGVATGTANPYFSRFSSSASSTVLADALAQSPTFFSLWIGGNDELGYATAGGDASVNPLTATATFDGAYNTLVSQLVAGGRKGVVANLPYVTTLPYFYVIKYNQLKQTDLVDTSGNSLIPTLNAQLYGPLHNALAFLGQGSRINLLSTTGNNPMIIKDETLVDLSAQLTAVLVGGGVPAPQATVLGSIFGQARQTLPTDLICLSASSRIGKPTNLTLDGVVSPVPISVGPAALDALGVTFPLPDRYVLLPTEVAEIQVATDAYNTTIQAAATANGLAFVDAKAIMAQLGTSSGITGNGFTITSAFITGGAFSTDGVHPSPRGYALIANKFIEAINAKYGSNIKGVSYGDYRILFPSSL